MRSELFSQRILMGKIGFRASWEAGREEAGCGTSAHPASARGCGGVGPSLAVKCCSPSAGGSPKPLLVARIGINSLQFNHWFAQEKSGILRFGFLFLLGLISEQWWSSKNREFIKFRLRGAFCVSCAQHPLGFKVYFLNKRRIFISKDVFWVL